MTAGEGPGRVTGELDRDRSTEQRLDALEHAAQLELDWGGYDDEAWLDAELVGWPDDDEAPAP